MSDHVQALDRLVGHQKPVLTFKVGAGASCPLDDVKQQWDVFGVDPGSDQLGRHERTLVKPENAIELFRPRNLVCRYPPVEATGQAEVLSLRKKCLAAPQLFFAFRYSTQIVGHFRLFARRDVLESHQNPALGMAREGQRTGVEN